MYAFVLHAHQKIDRAALRYLHQLTKRRVGFPTRRQILHFEGGNGPDAPKFKRVVGGQPWHFVDPFDPADTDLEKTISQHYDHLVTALRATDPTRAAFEAAWLAHAIVDGLTPPHHYPYEAELEALRGSDRHNRTSLKSRGVVIGKTLLESLKGSFKLLGPKGLLTTHTTFEAGAYMILVPSRLRLGMPSPADVRALRQLGMLGYFRRQAKEVAALGMFDTFRRTGWTPKLTRQVRRELAPRMVKAVTLAWYAALVDAGLVRLRRR